MNQMTHVFKLLSDDTRLRMLLLLYQEALCVCQISGILQVPQPRVSKNLAKLRDLDLVVDQRMEKFIFYTLRKENAFLMQTLEQILKQEPVYHQVRADSTRLADREKYINQCCPITES